MCLEAADNPCSAAVRIKLDLNPIADKNLNSVQTHLPSEVREYLLISAERDAKQRVREGLIDDSLNDLFFCHICVDRIARMRRCVKRVSAYWTLTSLTVTWISVGSAGNVLFQKGSTRA